MTIKEMAEKLGLGRPAVKMRLRVAGIKPIEYAGPTAIYDPSVLDSIRDSKPRGRPPKAKPEAADKPKKAKK